MPVALAVWSLKVEPGEPIEFAPEGDLVITNAALGDELADESSRTSLKLRYLLPSATEESDSEDEKDEEEDEDEPVIMETVLCSLTPGKIEQANINLTLDGDSEYLLEAVGKNTLYLSGNYIDQTPEQVPFNDEDDSDDEDEDGYDLRDVSSDVEMDPAEMIGIDGDESDDTDGNRFEEVHEEEAVKSNKRPRESDATEADKPSKAQEKKAKKQKAANGDAVPAAEPAAAAADVKAEKKQKKKEKKEKEAAAAKEAEKGGELKTLPSGLQIKDIKIGTGPQAKVGNNVAMRYIGKLQNGKVFDKNTGGVPFSFKLGKGEVIKGWDEGIKGMAVGGERLLVVPAALGYGKKGMKPDIPGNATLTFETKLVNIK
ncbi:unnamed protein product [Peniophora sp. CBMAI 1063]|nr:unnamed protein product [Peniophora sp. CBMAI 1063]